MEEQRYLMLGLHVEQVSDVWMGIHLSLPGNRQYRKGYRIIGYSTSEMTVRLVNQSVHADQNMQVSIICFLVAMQHCGNSFCW